MITVNLDMSTQLKFVCFRSRCVDGLPAGSKPSRTLSPFWGARQGCAPSAHVSEPSGLDPSDVPEERSAAAGQD